MKKQHTKKCASQRPKYHGDMRILSNYMKGDCDCDGYHTFDELYDHRITLYISLCKQIIRQPYQSARYKVWRSKRHSDGELCFGTGTQYIVGIGTKSGEQITYHVPIERWRETDFIEEYVQAPAPWDGHTSDDVLERLRDL